jgi:predicted RNase H-like HicB family nuclease
MTQCFFIYSAQQVGIDTEGKTVEEVKEELNKNRPQMGEGGPLNDDDHIKNAEEAGIETDGKTTEEIMEELGIDKPLT